MAGYAVLDLETTGIHTGYHHRVVEVAVVQLDPELRVEREWCTLIDPRRDLGDSTQVHGLRSSDLAGAPTFEDVASDLFDAVAGRRIVAHNASFDLGFFAYETNRAGLPLTWPGAVCTLMLGSALGLPTRLGDMAAAVGVEHRRAHSAADDALATAGLFSALAHRFHGGLGAVAAGVSRFPTAGWPPGSGQMWSRSQAKEPRPNTELVARLASRVAYLPGGGRGASSQAALSYAELLDRVLEDRVLTTAEVDELLLVADGWGLSTDEVTALHLTYLTQLVGAALDDAVCTDDELCDLERVTDLLGIDRSVLDGLVNSVPSCASARARSCEHELAGMTVCFTGACTCSVNGERLTREAAELLAASAGLIVAPRVTKQLDLLVVADPDSMSGKAQKARDYGTRVIAERAFWPAIGVAVD